MIKGCLVHTADSTIIAKKRFFLFDGSMFVDVYVWDKPNALQLERFEDGNVLGVACFGGNGAHVCDVHLCATTCRLEVVAHECLHVAFRIVGTGNSGNEEESVCLTVGKIVSDVHHWVAEVIGSEE